MEEGSSTPNIKIKRIIAPYLSGQVSGVIGEGNRVTAFETLRKVIKQQQGREGECPLLDSDADSAFHIVKRIGSRSRFAQVYEVAFRDFPGVKAALKVMPIESDKTGIVFGISTFSANLEEIKIARRVSLFVETGVTPYFPYFYGGGLCKEVDMQPPSDDARNKSREVQLFDRAKEYTFRETIIEQLTEDQPDRNDAARELRHKLHGWSIPRMAAYYERHSRPSIEFVGRYNFGVRAHVMIMELAYGDLYQFVKQGKFTKAIGEKFILQTLQAIESMHNIVHVVHNDLHIKNILVAYQLIDGALTPVPLIHDFGYAKLFNDDDEYEHERKEDIARFLRTLQSQKPIAFSLRARMTDMLNDMTAKRVNTATQAIARWKTFTASPGRLEASIHDGTLLILDPLDDEDEFDTPPNRSALFMHSKENDDKEATRPQKQQAHSLQFL